MFLPACLALLAWPLLRLHRAWLPVSMLAIACLPIVAQSLFVARPPSVSSANNVDVVLGALLPAARDQSQALMALGLPSQCGDVIGSTWYVTMGEDLRERCPDVFTLPKGRQLALLADDPLIAVRVLMKAAPLAQSALLHYVGAVEDRRLAGYGRADGLAEFSVAAVIERLPVVVYLGMVLGTLCLLLLAGSGWLVIALRGGIPAISMLLGAALSGTFAYAALTSVLGDGYVEVSRHFYLGSMALAGLLVLAAILGVLRVQGLMTRSNRPGTRPGWFEAIVIASWVAVGAACPLWLDAWKRQALTIGTIDEPQSNRVPAGVVLMHGWALDPLSDISVMTVVGRKTDIPGHRWLHPGDPQGAELAQIFPTYRDPHNARFEIAVDPARFPPGPLSLRTYARSVEGVLTEIDRRVLRWPER